MVSSWWSPVWLHFKFSQQNQDDPIPPKKTTTQCHIKQSPSSSSMKLSVTSGEQNADEEWENVPKVQLPSCHRSSQPSLAACWSRHSFHRPGVVVVLWQPQGDAFLSPPLSNDHTKSFLRTRRCRRVPLCGLLILRGRSRQAPLHLHVASARTVPAVPTWAPN